MDPTMRLFSLICVCCFVLVIAVVSWVPTTRKYVSDYSAPIVYWGRRTGNTAMKTFLPADRGPTEQHHSGAKLVHLVWMANPLKPYTISAIDSVLRYVPHATLKLHIITPEGANSTVLSAVKRRFEYQLSRFIEHPNINLQVVLHPNVHDEFIGTPLEKHNIPQKYFGGLVAGLVGEGDEADRGGTPFGRWRNALVHSADVMRVIILWREGGLYLDVDHILLDNIWPLVEVAPAFIVCETKLDGQDDGRCKTINGFFAATKGHPFLWDCMERISVLINEYTINGIWPLRAKEAGEPNHVWFTAVGPDLFAKVKNVWLDDRKDVWTLSGPEVYPSALTLEEVRHRPYHRTPQTWQNTTEPLYVMPRRYFLPTSWQDLTLNKKLDPAMAATYTKAYGFHLWEMNNTPSNIIRPKFLDILRNQPDSTLTYLYKKYCLLFCDPEQLVSVLPGLNEFMQGV